MEYSKSLFYKSLSFLIIVITLLAIYSLFWGPARDLGASFMPARTVTVSASDKMSVEPDIATLSFSVITEGKNNKNITSENNTKINSAISLLKKAGIKNDDIKTSQYELTPIYSRQNNKSVGIFVPTIQLYKISQTVSVKIRNFDLLSGIIGKLPNLGINKINGIVFSIENKDKYLNEIQKNAFTKAKSKAKEIAKQSGIKLGRIVNVSINSNSPILYYRPNVLSTESGGNSTVNPNIKSGSQKLDINVSIKYEIK